MHALHAFLLFRLLGFLGGNADVRGITNGEEALDGSMLYMASLQNNRGHTCGGFLIRDNIVVSAAQCYNADLTHVVLGTHDLKSVDNGNIRSIEKTYIHPSYEDVGKGSDIMLLKLSGNVELNKTVNTISLPTPELNMEGNCQVAGWGYNNGRQLVDKLRVVNVSIINHKVCENQWPALPANVICAGGYGTDKGFCQGDSGGPLVCNGKAVGVVSFNYNGNCDYPNQPNIYTEVSKYLDWIKCILMCYE
ncbi:trypsin-3-like [Anoplopoma fimbria]|uniref:trypsin-3-like n=1 Tax=Anoplopoma fimbria TaxID=229290 RepID=UPI0023ECF7D2|nr:trypsin-3-like [Anoplopoma fimbria]